MKLRRFSELVAGRAESHGVPFLGAIGAQDLSEVQACDNFESCNSSKEVARAGDNLAWRQAMRARQEPWGGGDPVSGGRVRLEPVGDGELSQRHRDITVEEAGGGELSYGREVPAGGASTHYTVDIVDADSERRRGRLVFVDSSLGSLAASDPVQQPAEPDGGQLRWLERMICVKPAVDPSGAPCTREPDQAAIVVSNTPTYTYGPGVGRDTAGDSVVLETTLMRHRASLVLSGRIGWNGVYWATAPGVHEPCPGGEYPTEPPAPGTRLCGESVDAGEPPVGEELASVVGAGQPLPPPLGDTAEGLIGLLPFVVASGAGGKFAAEGEARDGYWHGYTLVRLAASGDPRATVIEQRPIYDWVSIEAQDHTLRPGQKMTLRGYARGPIGTKHRNDGSVGLAQVNFDRIDGPAVTHRYDLVLADPQRPYVPLEDANGDYVPVPAQVATVDRQTGAVKAGRGTGERTYAIGVLSVGDKAASWPLAFEPRRSFAPQRARTILPPLPRAARAPAAQPPVRVADAPPPPPAQPPAQPGSPLASQTLQPPQPPVLPTLPAAQAPPNPQAPTLQTPPPPPPPPVPPAVAPPQQPAPLGLNAKLQPVSIVPSVNPPAPPPVNPAPPAGTAARKEAKQKQAAVAKSEEGESGDKGAQADVNVGSDPSHGASRLDGNERHAFTRHEQASFSPLAQTAIYGGGTALMALALALAWSIGRPGPRLRPPEVPAPAHAVLRGRRR
jgi:hypothetical protein